MKIKRVLLHSVPPWAPSGYGLQCRYLAQALRQLGYEVAISAFAGCHETRLWNGYQILSCGTRPYGNGVIAGNYKKWRADLLISLGDLFVLDPGQFEGLNFMPIIPVDCTPLSVMDKSRLDQLRGPLLHPVAMSRFGARVLAAAGYDAPVLPHCTKFRPDPQAGREWRHKQRVRDDIFLISKVGVNNNDDRKAFSVTLQAFAEFARDRDDVGLYLHTEPQAAKAPNLAYMALDLGLARPEGSKVVFAEEHTRAVDGFDEKWMHGMYCAADVLDAVSKAEGFGVPAIEALACGTPVIAANNSAMPEKVNEAYGWLVDGQREWASHHHAWWQTPSVTDLAAVFAIAYANARYKREAAAKVGATWSFDDMKAQLKRILADLEPVQITAILGPDGRDSGRTLIGHREVFSGIYAREDWGSGSGPGSDPAAAPEYVSLVSDYIEQHDITSVLDLGCGDRRIAEAIKLTLCEGDGWPPWSSWTGLDIIDGHDIRTCELPAAQLVLIKDVFQHWPNADIAAMRDRLAKYEHVLITNTIAETVNGTPANTDIPAGQWRGVDLAAEPFGWPVTELLRWERNGETKVTVRLR